MSPVAETNYSVVVSQYVSHPLLLHEGDGGKVSVRKPGFQVQRVTALTGTETVGRQTIQPVCQMFSRRTIQLTEGIRFFPVCPDSVFPGSKRYQLRLSSTVVRYARSTY